MAFYVTENGYYIEFDPDSGRLLVCIDLMEQQWRNIAIKQGEFREDGCLVIPLDDVRYPHLKQVVYKYDDHFARYIELGLPCAGKRVYFLEVTVAIAYAKQHFEKYAEMVPELDAATRPSITPPLLRFIARYVRKNVYPHHVMSVDALFDYAESQATRVGHFFYVRGRAKAAMIRQAVAAIKADFPEEQWRGLSLEQALQHRNGSLRNALSWHRHRWRRRQYENGLCDAAWSYTELNNLIPLRLGV